MIIFDFLLSLYCWTVIIVFTVCFGVFAIAASFISPAISNKTAKLWGTFILKLCGINVKVYGEENLSTKNSYIITSNHQSYFDIFTLLAFLKPDFRFIAKKSLFEIPFLGWSMTRLGYVPIDRKNIRSALKSVKKAVELTKNNTSILIFPEGSRSSDGSLQDFKKGGLNMLTREENIYVLPVVVKGTVEILRKGGFSIRPFRKVELHILKPMITGKEKGLLEKIENGMRDILELPIQSC